MLSGVACSSSKPSAAPATTAPATIAPATTTTGAPTRTTMPTTSTTGGAAPATTRPAPASHPATPITIATSTDGVSPDGSGCSPASGTTLPDGTWFGILTAVDPAAGTIGLDLACWYTGAAADAAATADHPGTVTPVPNDYYIRNQVPTVYTIPAAPTMAVVPLDITSGGPTGGLAPAQTGVAAAAGIASSATPRRVWVVVQDGWATVVQAQFTP